MSTTTLRVLRWLMWFVAAFHLFVGLSINLSPSFTQMIASSYGATVDWSPQFVYILKPLGAFMIVLGIFAAIAARDPLRYSVIVLGFCVLFIIRALQRLVLAGDINIAFGIPASRSIAIMVAMLVLAAVLFFLYRSAAGARRPVT